MQQRLQILDVDLHLAGPEAAVAPIAAAYRRFVAGERDPARPCAIRLAVSEDLTYAEVGTTRVELLPELDATAQTYQLVLDRLMDGLGSHALLHAAALVDRRGRTLLLAAPSGHGKTSLTLELAARGFGFLGDDYAPLDLARSSIAPYPRAVGLVTGGQAPVPEAFARQARAAGPVLMGKRLLDVGDVLGEACLVRTPQPLAHVMLLVADETGAARATTQLRVGARRTSAEELERVFGHTAGVRILERGGRGELAEWRLELRPEAHATAALAGVLESDRVLFAEKSWAARPAFRGEPAAVPVTRREAAELLGRELLNRRRRGRLLAAYDGSLTALFFDLASALRETACWRVRVGGLARTADLVTELVDRGNGTGGDLP